jgi:hypothetical protein
VSRRTNHAHADEYRAPKLEEQLAGTMFAPATEPVPPVRRVEVGAHMRTLPGAPKPDGATRKAGALDDHERQAAKRAAIVHVRARLLGLYRSRVATNPKASVNADDVDAILRAWPQFDPQLRDGSQNWRGVIFAGKGWERTGEWARSKRPEMNNHLNPCWRPVL